MRPITILQAVGAFIVGRLVILRHSGIPTDLSNQNLANFMLAPASIYFSYGAGMAMNDCVDASLDAQHGDKQNRSIASGRISRRNGCLFCVALTLISLIFSKLSANTTGINGMRFLAWNGLNLLLMAGYALGLQKIFLVKNLICGWLAISPLVGASLFSQNVALDKPAIHKLYQLAAIGFPLQVSREIIKDIEDMDTDNGEKQTLPLLIGETWSKRIAYGLVGIINVVMIIFPHYWRMFASMPPVHAVSVALGVPMCLRASVLPLAEGQQLLKKSIYVLLVGMIGGLLLQ
jgi:4-hydroxybenzoate polyprenyltransferase